jgi:hypothetical protein
MDRSRGLARPAPARTTIAAGSDRILRVAGDVRLAAVLLLLAAAWNAAAAVAPSGPASLDSPVYLLLLGAILLTGLAGVAVRLPAAWREWRRPTTVPEGRGALTDVVESIGPDASATAAALGRLGYRTVVAGHDERWAVHGARRGWTRFAGLGSHVALLITVIGAGIGTAYATETTFTLLPGEQALLDAPRPGFTDAVRFDGLDAAFDADGRPRRLDTAVTFLRDGEAVSGATLQVNAPGSFGGYLVHGSTYGPAARLRVTTLGDRVLHDGPLALAGERDGRPAALVSLPSTGQTMALVLADAAANTLALSVTGTGAPADATILVPGEAVRLGDLRVRLDGFTSWVTFMARRDPGMGLLFAGAALLSACLAVVFWIPRRRVTVRPVAGGLRVVLRGERFDQPADELARLRRALAGP